MRYANHYAVSNDAAIGKERRRSNLQQSITPSNWHAIPHVRVHRNPGGNLSDSDQWV